MFQNFVLHSAERPFMGVPITPDLRRRLRELGIQDLPEFWRWVRLVFGWKVAPFFAVSMMMRAVEVAKRAPWDDTSEFRVAELLLNLPGSVDYDPALPRVRLLRADGTIASDVVVYVDDGRLFAIDLGRARLAARQLTAGLQQLGIQDAGRKRELGGLRPRAWTGGIVHTDKGSTCKFIAREKWVRLKGFITDILQSGVSCPRDRFESGLGFLVHVSAIYDFLRPYLVGFYLVLHQYRERRNEDGWFIGNEDILEEELDLSRIRY